LSAPPISSAASDKPIEGIFRHRVGEFGEFGRLGDNAGPPRIASAHI